jgi:hypothetical protein
VICTRRHSRGKICETVVRHPIQFVAGVGAIIGRANISDAGPTGSCLLSLRRQNELLCRATVAWFTVRARSSRPIRHSKPIFAFRSGHDDLGLARKWSGFDFFRLRVAVDGVRRAALRAGLRPAHLTPTL